jgi:hypothetical protein
VDGTRPAMTVVLDIGMNSHCLVYHDTRI